MRLGICFLFFLFYVSVTAQYSVSGKVLDSETNSPLAFTNISINASQKGTISDINGNFTLRSNEEIVSIRISYLGYEDLILSKPFENRLEVKLKPSLEQLDEVILTNGENPAIPIIRKVIANKAINNPMRKGGFTYTSYSKSIVDSDGIQKRADSMRTSYLDQIHKGELKKDTLSALQKTYINEGSFHVMILESVTERKFLPPDLSKERVIASKVSGFDNAFIAMLATELQPFGFYEETIDLLYLHFLNPIAKGSIKKYDYTLEDEFVRDTDTIYHISFRPKSNVNIDGLKGFMYINSSGYAIQNIVAQPYENLKTTLKIQQKYNRIEGKDWFPEQLNFEIRVDDLGVQINGITYLKDVEFVDNLSKKDFDEVGLSYEENANLKDEEFWKTYRTDSLNVKEKRTYRVIDSLGDEFKLDKVLSLATRLGSGAIPWGPIDLKIDRFFNYNLYEKLRLGLGVETNEKLFKNIRFGGYFAYGFGDNDWKFGTNFRYDIDKANEFEVEFAYSNDIREIGSSSLRKDHKLGVFSLRSFIASEMDIVEQFKFTLSRRNFKYLTWRASLQNEWIRPQYDYVFSQNSQAITNYRNVEANLALRYAYREKFVKTPFSKFSLGTPYPVVELRYAKGFDSFLDGSFDYHKLEASISQSVYMKNIGETRYRVQSGIIEGSLPLGLLFTGEGSYNKDYPIVMYDYFQTMSPYEFVSDRYVHLFITHDFGSLFFKEDCFSPSILINHNMGWGNLQNTDVLTPDFQTMEHLYIESGLELRNLIDYDGLGYKTGIGIGGFYRYGFYGFKDFDDNFVIKINTSIRF